MDSSPITKTAYDALQAKLSVINNAAGYDNVVVENQHVYKFLLNEIVTTTNKKKADDDNDDDNHDDDDEKKNITDNTESTPLRQKRKLKFKLKPQTPLVNAGYACRIRSITSIIQNYIQYHNFISSLCSRNKSSSPSSNNNNDNEIQIVILGCGLDIIGLWSSSLLLLLNNEYDTQSSKSNTSTVKLKVIELDVVDICIEKRKILLRQNLIIEPTTNNTKPSSSSSLSSTNDDDDDNDNDAVLVGTIRSFHNTNNNNNNMVETTTPVAESISTTTTCIKTKTTKTSKYILCPVDLRDSIQLSKVTEKYINQDVPTLVISELVLAYLDIKDGGSSNDCGTTVVDNLLNWCSKHLCSCPGSAMTILEPLGPTTGAGSSSCTTTNSTSSSSSSSHYMSVIEGYKSKYSQDFESKMDKGKSNNTTKNNDSMSSSSSSFSPFASTLKKASSRFIKNGWNDAYATNLGISTSQTLTQTTTTTTTEHSNNESMGGFIIPEIFDEHAALILHLKSYGVVCAFSENTDELLKRLICRWRYIPTGEIPPLLSRVLSNNNNNNNNGSSDIISDNDNYNDNGSSVAVIAYTYIEQQDEVPMRTLFYNTYCGKFEQYPAIRKMMEKVMKSDLSMEPTKSELKLNQQPKKKRESSSSSNTTRCFSSSFSSVIGERYKSLGGGFIVAIQYDKDTKKRQIIGCVGIRKCESSSSSSEESTAQENTLEIFRLAVHEQHRRKRIGQNLLLMVEKIAQSKPSCKRLVANTLTILDSANRLYERCGFVFEKDTQLGSLVMRTYIKEI